MKFLFGLIVGAVLAVAALVAYFVTGLAPAAATDPPMPFERAIAEKSLDAHIARTTAQDSPVPADQDNLVAGADEYIMECADCHGRPGAPETDIAAGMYPRPPQFFSGGHAHVHDTWETYWKVANGIRLTGMPAFKGRLSDTELWQATELLTHVTALPDAVKEDLAGPPPGSKQK